MADHEAPYAAFVDTGDWAICSASPELFFRLEGDLIESRPMKGTAARGLWPSDDRRKAADLRASEKDQAENVMIVDMVRNDLGRIAVTGTVHVPQLFTVEQYPTRLADDLHRAGANPGAPGADIPGAVPARIDHRCAEASRHGDHLGSRDALPAASTPARSASWLPAGARSST